MLANYDRIGVPKDCIRVYMKIDLKHKELPLLVCDTQQELADLAGVSVTTVRSSISRLMSGERKTSEFIYVDIPIYEDNIDV